MNEEFRNVIILFFISRKILNIYNSNACQRRGGDSIYNEFYLKKDKGRKSDDTKVTI